MIATPQEIVNFIEIARTQNITKAAQRLGLTQPALSLSLKKLEETIGEKLIIRSKAGAELTVAGKTFYKNAKLLLDQWEKIRSDTINSTHEVKGNVKLGCHTSVGLYTLGHFVPQLLKAYPELEMTFTHDLSRKICDQVINYELDMGLVINATPHPDLVMIKLLQDEVKIWHLKNNDTPNVLICHPELIQTQSLLKKIKKQYQRYITSNNLEIITKLTLKGAGHGIIPGRVVAPFNESKKLAPLKSGPIFKDQLSLIYRVENKNIEYIKVIKDNIVRGLKP